MFRRFDESDAYDNLGNRTSLTFGNGVVQAFTFDPVSRLASLTNNLSGTTNDLTVSPIVYNPASQITSTVRTGDTYAWTGHGNGSTAFTQNGLNQQISIGGSAATWDSKGNLTTEPQSAKTYGYSSENLLNSATGGVTLGYDPALRLYQVAGAATTRFAYDGLNAIAEYNGSNALQRRYVFGPGVDQPLVQYEGTGTTDRRFMSTDERGSIISLTDSAGALLNIDRYDEYGKPQTTNAGRFQYTGQMWLSELGAYYYKARVYLPHLGIFAQSDPIGTAGGVNLYAYVGNDPLNSVDPLGLLCEKICDTRTGSIIPGVTPNGWSCSGNCIAPFTTGGGYYTTNSDYPGFSLDPSLAACARDAAACPLGSSAAQSSDRGFWDVTRWSRADTAQTINALFNKDLDVQFVFREVVYSGLRYRLEYGVWVSQRGSDYFASSAIFHSGLEAEIYPMGMRPPGASIFFHFHQSATLNQGLSDLDFNLAQRYGGFLIISLSRFSVLDWADFRQ